MNKIKLLIVLLTLTPGLVFSQEFRVNNDSFSESGANSNASAAARSDGVIANDRSIAAGAGSTIVHSTSTATGADLSEAVGAAVAPALTTTLTETCMGSTSVGAGFSGGSFSFGTTWRDTACVRRLDARQIQSMGDVQAAKEIMCDSELVRDAFKRVGRPCAEDGGVYTVVKAEAPAVVVAPVVAPAPAATQDVRDDQDVVDQKFDALNQRAEQLRQEMRESNGF